MLQKLLPNSPILQATFGIERESLRINSNHRVAQTPHPHKLGSRSFHPYIQTDYSEPQLELITPIAQSTKEARRLLGAITDVAARSMDKQEYLWPLSMPPVISEDDIQIAQLESDYEYQYRVGLGERYGKLLQSMSGIHYNFELGKDLTQQLFELSEETDFVAFKNTLYLKLAQNFLNYRWLLTYLYGASSLAEKGFLSEEVGCVRSIRNSKYGYVNSDDVHISFSSLEQYVDDIEQAVQSGQLSAEKEFYSAVRLRGAKTSRDYLSKGISYLEFRSFDLNPYDPLAISQETLDTVHLFILSLLWLDQLTDVDNTLAKADKLNNLIALSHPHTPLPSDADATPILTAMKAIVAHFGLDDYYGQLIAHVEAALQDPHLTLSGKIAEQVEDGSLEKFGQQQGLVFHDYAWTTPYALKGYENMELSTQMILFDAIQLGLNVEILDEEDQFLKLWHGDHVEYIKNGNMTSKDNYVIPLAMANKVVTKKILDQAGFPVPAGAEFANKTDALRYYGQVASSAIVVKPKSTNFGLGISIFQEPASLADYEKALDIAFSEDSHVLVEEFVAGTEYRFFILDGKCEAVLLRVAANVVGDGSSTIRELVDQKNQDPLRGRDHRSPLEIINLGDIELLMLEQQGYTPDTVLPEGVQAFLRGNSNISTGGDSIDMTDQMDESYKQLAADMATAMGAWTCGVDLIIPDRTKPASKDKPNCTCIELNFNPAMYLHTYTYAGPGQSITPKILKKLFPEL
ncbi:bifunctional glutamate--cysteine ligase GshA/glutathione synthetase GshB [Streptococcus suis]|uniref:Glutathione biosynthesis bifunctional protein GshAB n=1 Tax=Streptococcus suis TaxID=1307 RepID=A0A0Z8SLI3_STRSU|nr:bifunctional glutamate--cysteine ligase GshA/glutathione synthetase GshB [Streptococcus suis]NQN60269.1 bifunctional glutamate--cysteine ligase GshA/glutathione synthetase GshB [Streptococcus suis]NQP75911.1 bifunctional glutamate--cysteine ligase GshA/glutathione synthetase GshB [Streptococcus suis]NQP77939.1 bifunctional glutamate--cysteine ligase GshA/glutathione synthetase GshB [Streptococcus suis]NQP92242.1 bifunctional glutamate--cysteine ligase GshA/glutathione synthetase GshB [Strept